MTEKAFLFGDAFLFLVAVTVFSLSLYAQSCHPDEGRITLETPQSKFPIFVDVQV